MAIFADLFTDMMASVISVEPLLSRAYDGAATYGPLVDYQARINNTTQNVINAAGQLVVARGCAWLDTVDPITVNDRITFPGGEMPNILRVDQGSDETGPCFTKLYFQ